jgi:hypothetical protein
MVQVVEYLSSKCKTLSSTPPLQKTKTCKKERKKERKMQNKKGWRYSSSGRMPAQQAQSPDFKPEYHQTNK